MPRAIVLMWPGVPVRACATIRPRRSKTRGRKVAGFPHDGRERCTHQNLRLFFGYREQSGSQRISGHRLASPSMLPVRKIEPEFKSIAAEAGRRRGTDGDARIAKLDDGRAFDAIARFQCLRRNNAS